jgi:RNA polymerase sigma-70 factor, ECF subfamily
MRRLILRGELMIATPNLSDAPTSRELEETFREYARLIYRTAYGVTGSREDAEDVLQTVFLRLLRQECPGKPGRNMKAYLYRAAVNLSLDTLRSHRRHPSVDDTGHIESMEEQLSPAIDNALHRQLYEAIAMLKPDAAEIVILRYVHDYSDAEIAKMLGVSRGTIALKLFRSRARLKKLLREGLRGKL